MVKDIVDRKSTNLSLDSTDNLDRIVPVQKSDGKTNHDEIFIDRADQLRSLECNIIYTVPISLVHSSRIVELANVYDPASTQILPMVSVRKRNGNTNPIVLNMVAISQDILHKIYKF